MKNLKYTFSSTQIRSGLRRCSLVLVMLVTLHVTLCGNELMENRISCCSLDLNPEERLIQKKDWKNPKRRVSFLFSIRLFPTIAPKSNAQRHRSVRMRTLRARMTQNLLLSSAKLQCFRFPVLSFSPSQLLSHPSYDVWHFHFYNSLNIQWFIITIFHVILLSSFWHWLLNESINTHLK